VSDKEPEIEILGTGRYTTVTGRHFGNTPLEIRDATEALVDLAQWMGRPDSVKVNGNGNGLAHAAAAIAQDHRPSWPAELLLQAAQTIPNDDLVWDEWNNMGMRFWAASRGSEAGFLAFDAFSQQSSKYDPVATEERWQGITKSPPTMYNTNSLLFAARWFDREFPDWTGSALVDNPAQALFDRLNPQQPQPQAVPDYEAFCSGIIRPTEWQDKPVPERRWHVDGWLPEGYVSALYGTGGIGKTILAQQLLTATALGSKWLGLDVKQCRAIGFFCEDKEDELHIRQDAINRLYECSYSDLDDLELFSRVGFDNLLMDFTKDGTGQATRLYNFLLKRAQEFKAEFVVIDTAADTFGGNENVRGEVRQFVQKCLGHLAREIGGTVLLCAHPSVAGMSTGTGGSTAWSNTVRSRLHLCMPQVEKDAEPDRNARILELPKANYAATGELLALTWKDGTLQLDPRITGYTGGTAGHLERIRCDQVFLKLLRKATADGRDMSDKKQSSQYAPKMMARMEGRETFTYRDFQRAMERLFDLGVLKCVKVSRDKTKLVECDHPAKGLMEKVAAANAKRESRDEDA
jgi:RecA-family ATPase